MSDYIDNYDCSVGDLFLMASSAAEYENLTEGRVYRVVRITDSGYPVITDDAGAYRIPSARFQRYLPESKQCTYHLYVSLCTRVLGLPPGLTICGTAYFRHSQGSYAGTVVMNFLDFVFGSDHCRNSYFEARL